MLGPRRILKGGVADRRATCPRRSQPPGRIPRAHPYEMAFRPDDGFWGVVASRVVDLAYEDKVWTMIGGLDGQRTHIAELIVAKAWVPVVSPWTSDTSVDYANVPWVFRCAPADSSQVDALVAYAKARASKSRRADRDRARSLHRLQTAERKIGREAASRGSPAIPSHRSTQVVPRVGVCSDAILVWAPRAQRYR